MLSTYQEVKKTLELIPKDIASDEARRIGFTFTEEHRLNEIVEGQLYLTRGPIGRTGSNQLIVFLSKQQKKLLGFKNLQGTVIYSPIFKYRPTYVIERLENYKTFSTFIPVRSIKFGLKTLTTTGIMLSSDVNLTREPLTLIEEDYVISVHDGLVVEQVFSSPDTFIFNKNGNYFNEIVVEPLYFNDETGLPTPYETMSAINFKALLNYPILSELGSRLIDHYGLDFIKELTKLSLISLSDKGIMCPILTAGYLQTVTNEATMLSLLTVYDNNPSALPKAFNRVFSTINHLDKIVKNNTFRREPSCRYTYA